MSLVSNNIKYLRRLNGLTQEQFSRKIGIKRSLLGAYEEARANPNLTNLKNMATAFGVSVDHLLKNDLRRLRETPDLGIPFNPAFKPMAPLIKDDAPSAPQPLSAIVNKFQPPKPALRMVAKQVALKPVRPEKFERSATPITPFTANAPLTFNNHYEENGATKSAPPIEVKAPQQTIQWVKRGQANEYLANYQDTAFLNRLPVFQLPNLPSGHYRAFEASEDFSFPGALLVGSFVRNWYEIKDGTHYALLIKNTGVISRKVYNQVKAKGILLLRSDDPKRSDLELPIRDVLEVWEVKSFVSQTMPASKPSHENLKKILGNLRDELNRDTSSGGFLS
ncbi:helix-turn-helix domain-containing protein [Persicitalea sp.]|uniref:helix-turn-helix domain-containing protein n=1 Tax=Persicitalea sp. TaxID=3100273 RepID=UPI0035942597